MNVLRTMPFGLVIGVLFIGPALLTAADAKKGTTPSGANSREESTSTDTRLETKLVGDYTNFSGLNPVILDGVGLVTGLAGTGGDPAPSAYRTMLMEDLKKRGVKNPNSILASPNTALVVVRAYLPPMLKKGENLDLEVRLPESAQATSLAGGWLMETYLSESAIIPGAGLKTGAPYAKAKGAILVGAAAAGDKSTDSALLKTGRILGGATVFKERELAIYLRNDFSDVRNAGRIADAIGRRFHDFNEHGIKIPMAEAKTDRKIVLRIHPRYKENYPRYLQVIRHIAFRESPIAARIRLQNLQRDMLNPESCEKAALQLEAIGAEAIPALKATLQAPLLESRFHAAVALAYLEESAGIKVLAECARNERAFRVFALSALSTIDDADAHLALRELLHENSAETRYGAFRSLWVSDRGDPFLRGEDLHDGQFSLHAMPTRGDPMVHLTLHTRPEVVLFGDQQQFSVPLVLSAGRHIMVTAQPGSRTINVARFEAGKADQKREVSLNVAEVIRTAAEMGATYPDIVQMLAEAHTQHNLHGKLEMDALPEAGRVYERPVTEGVPMKGSKKAKIGKEHLTPNLFPVAPKDSDEIDTKPLFEESDNKGMANVKESAGTNSKTNSPAPALAKKSDKPAAPTANPATSSQKSSPWKDWLDGKRQ